MADFTKLSELVGKQFLVTEVGGYQFKKWDNEAKRMLTSDRYEQGFRKMYSVTTNKGQLDLSANQLATLLEAVQKHGQANIVNRTFEVKSNGKTGIDIRYFFNAVRQAEAEDITGDEDISLEDIPF